MCVEHAEGFKALGILPVLILSARGDGFVPAMDDDFFEEFIIESATRSKLWVEFHKLSIFFTTVQHFKAEVVNDGLKVSPADVARPSCEELKRIAQIRLHVGR